MTPWDPLEQYEELWRTGATWSPASELVNLIFTLQLKDDEGIRPEALSREQNGLIEQWCGRFGPLGVIPHLGGMASWHLVEPLKAAARDYGVRGLRQGLAGVPSRERPSSYDVAALERLLALAPDPREPVVEIRRAEDAASYAEPVEHFLAAAAVFLLAFVRPFAFTDEASALNAKALLSVVSPEPAMLGDRRALGWSSPSLLGMLAITQLLDDSRSCSIGHCEWFKCGRFFARRISTRRYCSDKHQNSAEKYRRYHRDRSAAAEE